MLKSVTRTILRLCRAADRKGADRVLYVQYTNPAAYPPLEHSSHILADAGWDVLFLGTGAFLDADALRFRPYPGIQVRQLRFCGSRWKNKLHYGWFCAWCVWWAFWWRPRLVYASDTLACAPALLLSRLLKLKLVYHEHDCPGPAPGVLMRFCMKARRACARKAVLCILPNAQRADWFVAETRRRNGVEVVWNCPELREIAVSSSHLPSGLRVIYHGSISHLRLSIIEAIALLPENVSLTIVGYETIGSQGHTQALLAHAKHIGIQNRVHCVGPQSRSNLMEICATCHVGLALIPHDNKDRNLQALTGASNKSFDYLACGLAVLVPDLPDWREMFVQTRYGLACNPADPDSIAAALHWFHEHPEERARMGERGRTRILNEWNYETQFQPVLHLLNL